MKKIPVSALIVLLFTGCATTESTKIVTDRDVAYVPYPSCPAPNKIEPTPLPIAQLDKNSNAKEIATAYVNSIAVLKSDLSAALSELKRFEEYSLESKEQK